MKKRITALLLLALICAIGMTVLSSCGSDTGVNGITLERDDDYSVQYDSTLNKTQVRLSVICYNNESDYVVKDYTFKVCFFDLSGRLIYTASDYEVTDANVYPGYNHYSRGLNYSVMGEVARVSVVPVSMTVVPYDAASDDDSSSSSDRDFGLVNIIGILISIAAVVVGIVFFYNAYFYDGTYIGPSWMANYPDEKFKAALSYVLMIGGVIAVIVCIFI